MMTVSQDYVSDTVGTLQCSDLVESTESKFSDSESKSESSGPSPRPQDSSPSPRGPGPSPPALS